MTDPAAVDAVATELAGLGARCVDVGLAAGLDRIGVCDASPFEETRAVLEARKSDGLADRMQFTYRNPARSTDPSRTLPGARSLVVAALRHGTEVPPRPSTPAGRVARYATADHYSQLRAGLEVIADELRSSGFRATVVADDNALVDRAAAVRAGLGWYGKSSNVLLEGRGSWFVLGSVITDAELAVTGADVPDGCGSCTACLTGCPTGAIVAPGVVDASRCLAWLVQRDGEFPLEYRVALGDRLYGCDECQEVCPPSRRDQRRPVDTAEPADPADPEIDPVTDPGSWVDLAWMLSAPDDELLAALGRWYVPRRDPRFLRRNALLALGNLLAQGAAGDPAALIGPYLDGEDDLLAGHAAWAALRGGHESLLDEADRGRRPPVLAERRRWHTERAGGETPSR